MCVWRQGGREGGREGGANEETTMSQPPPSSAGTGTGTGTGTGCRAVLCVLGGRGGCKDWNHCTPCMYCKGVYA
jgi:hypothetical protein